MGMFMFHASQYEQFEFFFLLYVSMFSAPVVMLPLKPPLVPHNHL